MSRIIPSVESGGGSSVSLESEDLSSQVNGVATVFTVGVAYLPGTLQVYRNGQKQIAPGQYAETTSTTFTMVDVLEDWEQLEVLYQV